MFDLALFGVGALDPAVSNAQGPKLQRQVQQRVGLDVVERTLDVMWVHVQMCIDLKDNMLKCENQNMQVPFLGEGDIPKRKPMPLTFERQNFECDAITLSV